MDVKSYALTAGTKHVFGIPHRFFMLIETGAPVTVRFRRGSHRSWEVAENVERGYLTEPGNWDDPTDRFDGFEILSAVNQTVRIGLSERRGDYRQILPEVALEQPDDVESTADVTVTSLAEVEVVASNANRFTVDLYNLGAAQIRVRESLGAATVRGAPIPAGMSRQFRTTGALYAVSEGADCDVAILEEVST